MDKIQALTTIGLTEKEATVYLALVELGKATVTKLSSHTKLHRPSVYDILERMVQKGLASHILEGETKWFEAAEPSSLLNVLQEKEAALKSMIPELALAKQLAPKGEAKIYEGVSAVKALLRSILELNDTIMVYGAPKIASEKMLAFLEKFHQERVKRKVQMLHIYNTDAIERVKYLARFPYTKSKFLPQEYNSPVMTMICKDTIIMTLWEAEIPTLYMRYASIAEAYKKYFKLLWEMAKDKP